VRSTIEQQNAAAGAPPKLSAAEEKRRSAKKELTPGQKAMLVKLKGGHAGSSNS
jgi:hypothetical protein